MRLQGQQDDGKVATLLQPIVSQLKKKPKGLGGQQNTGTAKTAVAHIGEQLYEVVKRCTQLV